MRKSTQLPRTSRVNEKIIEYYLKFGQDRDLEKYMRLYSPCGYRSESRSRSTKTTASSCQSEDEGSIFRRLFHQDTENTTGSDSEINVPIEIQTENMPGKCLKSKGDECTSSAPDLHTPPPRNQNKTNSKQTQTPESVARSHRRLEWDSLGDVGYKKSLSTSNISILERSVLKEYFQEISSITSSRKKAKSTDESSNQNKQDKKRGTCKTAELKGTDKHLKTHKQDKPNETYQPEKSMEKDAHDRNTPPLASSTMMDWKGRIDIANRGTRPKLVSQSTSMSLQKRYDQCAQTSIQRQPQLASREVQVSISSAPSSATSSNAADTATPSSFDYYSSRSTHSTTDGDDAINKCSLNNEPKIVLAPKERPRHIHPFVAGIHEMLASHKVLGSGKKSGAKSDKTASLQQVHDSLKQVLTENKENSIAASSILNSPQLDLGIQLLCSLIDARSLNQRQKKKLVRDIVKRISTLNIDDNDANEGEGTAAPSECAASAASSKRKPDRVYPQNMEATLKSTSTVTVARTAKASIEMSSLRRDFPSSTSGDEVDEQLVHIDVLTKKSPPTTSAKALAKHAEEKTKNSQKIQTMPVQMRAETQTENRDAPKLTNIVESSIKRNTEDIEKTPPNDQPKLDTSSDKASSPSKASTTSKDIITQKALINMETAGSSDTDKDVAANYTMREWLNPMTNSEIEYEEKKLEFARNAAKRSKIVKCLNSEKMDSERKSQLKWIQSEIQRLETLRCLLSKPNTERGHDSDATHLTQNDATAHEADKLYDNVFSDQQKASLTSSTSSSAPSSGNNPLQEIEVIIEESNEDVIELDDKIKRSKQRKRETQIVYDKPTETLKSHGNVVAGKARFRTMTETVTTNEEQVLAPEAIAPAAPTPSSAPATKEHQQQRSKIDTPSGDSNDGESVGTFAKQRKREFLEQYRNKKRIHYESLLHQQQQLLIQQQQQIIQELQQRCTAISHTTAGAAIGRYSIPHNMHHSYCPCVAEQRPYNQAYFQQPCNGMGETQSHAKVTRRPHTQPQCPPCQPSIPRAKSYQSDAVNYTRKTQTIHSEQSTSSIFCISSEVSIPMGSSSTTSSTTSHQYDDVAGAGVCAAGVGVQTGASLRRTQPIFGRRLLDDSNPTKNAPNGATYDPQPVCSGQSISVQVKPKAIAYVIQFDKKTTSSTTTTTTTATTTTTSTSNSNSVVKPSNDTSDLREVESKPCALRDYLVRAKPKFVAQTKERKAILNEIQAMRQERGRELRDIIENASENSLDMRLQRLPPPATKRLRIFATKEMKAMTLRHCENLPEIVRQQQRAREERRRHGNRLIRDIFNQRLQRRVRTGKLSLNHSKTVI